MERSRNSANSALVTSEPGWLSQRLTLTSTNPMTPKAKGSAIFDGLPRLVRIVPNKFPNWTAMAVLVPVTTFEPVARVLGEPLPKKWCSRGYFTIHWR